MIKHEDFATEHHLFWMLVKKAEKRTDVGRVYLAIQAALAYRRDAVDIAWLTGQMMADGQTSTGGDAAGIGASGLAYFYWLYEVELSAPGESDCHRYRFRRRYDGAQVFADLRTATHPMSLRFQQEYERERRRLERKRETYLANYRWLTTPEWFARCDLAVAPKNRLE